MNSIIEKEIDQIKQRIPLLFMLAWDEIKVRYQRSVLGPFWLVLATAISALGLGYVWSILFNQDKETFIPALCIGLVIWQFLSSCIIEAPNCFSTYSPIIKNTYSSILLFPAAIVIKNLIIFFHNLLIVIVVLVLYPQNLSIKIFLIIPGLLLVSINLVFIVTILAFIGARYRDFNPAVTSMMTIIFFLSPVIYKPEQLGIRELLMWFNPLTHLISLIRDPIIGLASQMFVYGTVTASVMVTGGISYYLVSKYRYRLVYWL